jgi:hypothetical protein
MSRDLRLVVAISESKRLTDAVVRPAHSSIREHETMGEAIYDGFRLCRVA